MKVIVLASLAYSLLNFRRALLAEMVVHGHEIIACAPEDDQEIEAALADMGIGYRRIAMGRAGRNPFADFATLAGYLRLFRREKPDVVLAYTQKPIIYGGLAARLTRARFFAMVSGLGYTFLESEGVARRLLRGLVSALFKAGVRNAETVFVFNRDDAGELRRHGVLADDHKVVQLPGSGIDVSRFAMRPMPAGPPTFLVIARLLHHKGLFEYVEAARRVRALCPEARFQLLGPYDDGPDGIPAEALDRWIAEGVVDYLGETRDVTPYLAGCTVFVLPSYREGLPRTVLEAMATGRAIITTDAPGCRETVIEGENGFLVRPRDPAALMDAMMRFVRAPSLAHRMGAESRSLAIHRFDVNRVNAMVVDEMNLSRFKARDHAPRPSVRSRIARRLLDIVIASVAGIALLPFIAVIAILSLLAIGSPIFFTQRRSGLGGRTFRLIKFRSMTEARGIDGRPLPDEERMTRFGRILRRTRMDELPELWNIIRGDMSLIGPRPILPETVAAMGAMGIERGAIRPGLTGWAQVNGNARLKDEDKLALDLWYIHHRTLAIDLSIIAQTVLVIILGDHINTVEIGKAHARGTSRGGEWRPHP